MLSLIARSTDILLRGRSDGEEIALQLGSEPSIVSMVPTPLLIGLGALLLSATVAIFIERTAEKADAKAYSAARF